MYFLKWSQKICLTLALLIAAFGTSACKKKKLDATPADVTLVSKSSKATSWTMATPVNGSTSKITTPSISGTSLVEAAAISLYLTSDCSDSALSSGKVIKGIFSIDAFTMRGDGLKNFSYMMQDASKNLSTCQDTGLSYTLDTAPSPPTLGTTPTLTKTAAQVLPVTTCNDSTTYLVSATTPLPTTAGWAVCSTTNGITANLTIEGTNNLKIWGKNVDGKVSETFTAVTITLDTIAPIAPTAWSMTPTSGTISTNSSPTITGSAAEGGAIVSVYTTNNCTPASLVGTGTVGSGTFSISSFTLTSDGPKTFYFTIQDPAGNATACATTGQAYTLDTTPPTATTLTINAGDASTNFRNVTLALSATETVSTPIQMCVAEDANCSTCSFIAYTTSKNLTLSVGSGAKMVSAKFRDALLNTSACIHSSITVSSLTVGPKYPAAPNWNDYVRASNTTQNCDGSESSTSACIHGGEQRRVVTARTSCTSLSMTDSLGVFDWTCSVVSGNAVFDSTLKSTKGLKDLVTATAWQNNSVTLSFGAQTVSSTPAAWWGNTVQALVANPAGTVLTLGAAGTVYTLASSALTAGYNIGADNIAVVTLNGATLSWNAGVTVTADNCSSDNGKTVAPNRRCILAAGSQKFLWIEGIFDGGASNPPEDGIFLSSVLFSKIRQAYSNNQNAAGIFLDLSSNYNTLSQITASNNAGYGVQLDSASQGNALSQVSTSNNTYYGVYVNASSSNALTQISANSNGIAGIYLRSSTSNIVTRATTNNHSNYGIYLRSSSSNIISNAVTANNGTGIFLVSSSNFNTFSQIAATDNATGISLNSASSNKFTGNLIIGNNSAGNCAVSLGTNPGLVNTTCTTTGTSGSATYAAGTASNASLNTGISAANSFIGKITADNLNTSGPAGTATYTSSLDWINFATSQRQWGKDGSAFPNSNQQGRCSAGTCRIWDWTLSASDVLLHETSGDGVSPNDPVSTGNCPSQIDGNQALTDKSGSISFLKNAVELIDDSIGNNNGLCESGETCFYTPNFGSYQGHGALQKCVFNDGVVTGVTIYWYSTNGR